MVITLRVPAKVGEVLKKFRLSDKEIYIVGGVVRDIMLDRPLYDWDFTTNATPEQMLTLFTDAFYDNKFGTVGIPGGADERPLEITTFRSEKGYSDSRHPDVITWGKTLEEDLQRRDFTINAMALRPTGTNKFELIDLYGGMDDVKAGLLKTVGNPGQRFAEDALRMMRAVRIATQLRFAIDEETFLAIKANVNKILEISTERVRDELLKILASDYPADGYLLLRNCGLGEIILPEMEKTFGVEQKSPGRHHIYDVGTHSVEALKMCPSADPITRLATLIHDVGKVKTQRIYPDGKITFYNHEMESEKIAGRIADRLKFSNEQKDKFVRLVRWHQFTVDENQTDSAIRRFIKNTGIKNVTEMLALRTGDRLGGGARETSWRLEEFKKRLIEVQKQPFAIPDLKISGLDVMKIKQIPSGPLVGKYLQVIFDEVTEKNLPNDRETLVKRLREIKL
jgi:tRNA nucleotidyltransferase/poly(A) polymerase